MDLRFSVPNSGFRAFVILSLRALSPVFFSTGRREDGSGHVHKPIGSYSSFMNSKKKLTLIRLLEECFQQIKYYELGNTQDYHLGMFILRVTSILAR